MNDPRTRIAVLAVVLGLGGLGGYAISANRRVDSPTTTTASAPATKVVRRTVHVKPKRPKGVQATGSAPATLTSRPVSSSSSGSGSSAPPVSTGSSGSSSSHPVTTGTSGSGGGGGEREDGGEREGGDD